MKKSGSMIPVSEPLLDERDLANLTAAFRSGWISSAGEYLDRFESAWAAYCGAAHGISVTNGTTALDIAMQSLGLAPGDEVILPTFTIISCATAILNAGAVPVLVDSEPRTWGMDVAQIESRITPRTRAIMAVHIYGHPAAMEPLLALAARHDLVVVEDAAEVHGAEVLIGGEWRRCGGVSRIATFSFYANKLVTTGEGGMIVTSDAALAERCRALRNLCFQPKRRFVHEELGTNARMTNLQAAIGLGQVERMDEIVARKRNIGHAYEARLRDVAGVELQVQEPWARGVYWVFGLVLAGDVPFDAAELAVRLRARGVDTRPFFTGMHGQPALLRRGLFAGERHPVAERIARRGLYLPSGLPLREEQIDEVCDAVREVLAR
jgi:perosamine synthetase